MFFDGKKPDDVDRLLDVDGGWPTTKESKSDKTAKQCDGPVIMIWVIGYGWHVLWSCDSLLTVKLAIDNLAFQLTQYLLKKA